MDERHTLSSGCTVSSAAGRVLRAMVLCLSLLAGAPAWAQETAPSEDSAAMTAAPDAQTIPESTPQSGLAPQLLPDASLPSPPLDLNRLLESSESERELRMLRTQVALQQQRARRVGILSGVGLVAGGALMSWTAVDYLSADAETRLERFPRTMTFFLGGGVLAVGAGCLNLLFLQPVTLPVDVLRLELSSQRAGVRPRRGVQLELQAGAGAVAGSLVGRF